MSPPLGTPYREFIRHMVRHSGKFSMDSGANRQTGGISGTNFDLWLDAADLTLCKLTVSSDDRHWVDTTFTTIMDILDRRKSVSRYVRTPWTPAGLQLLGVGAGFLLSLWAAVALAPHLKVEGAFAVALLFVFLLFSNPWGYALNLLTRLIDTAFPNIAFKRKDKEGLQWLARAVVGGLTVALILLVAKTLGFMGASMLDSIWVK